MSKKLKKMLQLVFVSVSAIAVSMVSIPIMAAPPREFESNEILFWNKNLNCNVALPGAIDKPGTGLDPALTQDGWTKVGVSVYGNWGDDNGQGALGRHAGHTMFAELSSPGTLDYKRLADVLNAPPEERGWPGGSNGYKPGSKFALSYTPNNEPPDQGNIIIMDKRDVGGGQGTPLIDGAPRAVDLWWEAAQLIGWTDYGLTAMWIKKVPDETPVTPLGSGPADPGAVPGGTGSTGSGAADQGACAPAPEGATGTVNANGYAFPVVLPKAELYQGWGGLPCPNICHHDGTGALDITKTPANDSGAGTPLVAIAPGTLRIVRQSYAGQAGCNSFQLQAEDGFYYYYTHIQTELQEGAQVKAGDPVGIIGDRRCTGNGSAPHLHIDRGWPQGRTGGTVGGRDPNFPKLINQLYNDLPG